MEATTWLIVAVLCVAIFFLLLPVGAERARTTRLLAKIPGVPALPVFGSFLSLLFLPPSDMFDYVISYHKKPEFKDIFTWWVGGRAFVSLKKPEYVEAILNNTQHIHRSFLYDLLHPWLGKGLLTSSGSKWHAQRKIITPSFHFKILDNFIEVFSEKSEILVQKLKRETGGPGFNVRPYISRCALDIICETAMGTSVHAQDDESSEYVTAVHEMTETLVKRAIEPWLHPDLLFNLTPTGRSHNRCLKILHGFTNKVVQERKAVRQTSQQPQLEDEDARLGKKRRVAFLDMLLEASEGEAQLTDQEIKDEVNTFMFEGHDTTTAAMSWALYLLGLHPDTQDKAYQEQERIFQGSDRSPTMKDLNEMKYLERVIKETLRLYPSVQQITRAVYTDIDLGEYIIPAGVNIDLCIFVIHRNPEQFPDPEKFDPDNFLPERVAKRHPYAYIPFSAGPRNCIGQKFALLEEKTVLSYVLRHYKVRSLDKMEDIKIAPRFILTPMNGVRLCLSSRKIWQNDNASEIVHL